MISEGDHVTLMVWGLCVVPLVFLTPFVGQNDAFLRHHLHLQPWSLFQALSDLTWTEIALGLSFSLLCVLLALFWLSQLLHSFLLECLLTFLPFFFALFVSLFPLLSFQQWPKWSRRFSLHCQFRTELHLLSWSVSVLFFLATLKEESLQFSLRIDLLILWVTTRTQLHLASKYQHKSSPSFSSALAHLQDGWSYLSWSVFKVEVVGTWAWCQVDTDNFDLVHLLNVKRQVVCFIYRLSSSSTHRCEGSAVTLEAALMQPIQPFPSFSCSQISDDILINCH